MSSDYVCSLSLVDGDGVESGLWEGHPVGGRYPTRAWDPGDHVRDTLGLAVPACIEPGAYRLAVAVRVAGREIDQVLGRTELLSVGIGDGTHAGPSVVLDADLGDDLVLLGYGLITRDGYTQGPVTVGHREGVGLILYWRHEGVEASRVPLKLTLLKADGQEWGRQQQASVGEGPDYCASYAYTVGPDTSPGQYRAKVRAVGLGKVEFDLPVRVTNRDRMFAVPTVQTVSRTTFGKCIRLEGYDVGGTIAHANGQSTLAPGDGVDLTLYWRALCPIAENYTVFAHLVDDEGNVVNQDDGLPSSGYSTLFWAQGELVQDGHDLATPVDTMPGDYRIEFGLYRALTGERLTAQDDSGALIGDREVVGSIRVALP
jgi:hypothetical protein